ncbi:CAAD domain-containing protein [Phormidium tenue FACHB-886]|nr:CAAD domain-containing protein [Phormidium tenue FACHB-886]
MESEMQQYTDAPDYTAEKVTVEIEPKDKDTLTETTDAAGDQLKQIGNKISAFLSDLPDYLTEFFGENKRPIVVVGLIFGALIAVKLLLAILGAINDIPLLSPLFELIGIGYTTWFVYRYLWKAENRRELSTDFNSLKQQVLGRISSEVE